MATRKLITISLPPPLLKKTEEVAKEENRTKSELLREALRFYIDTTEVRRRGTRAHVLAIMNRAQARASTMPPARIRRIVREAVESARRQPRRASA